jgi:CRP-like cAMP-binding protein
LDTTTLQKKLSRYIQLDENEAAHFLSLLEPRQIARRKFLLLDGDVCRHFSLVTEGCLMNYYTDENGFAHVLQFATHMWWTADLQSLMNETPALFSIQALVNSEVLMLPRPQLDQLFVDIPKFERYFRIIFQNALMAHQQRIIQNIAFPAEERYLQFREKYPHLERMVPQKYIASYLGVTPEFLSKVRRRLAKK